MNQQDQIKAVAELDGWVYKIVEDGHLFSDPSQPQKVMRWVSSNGIIFRRLPDYLTSRDAIISVIEKVICGNEDLEDVFQMHLFKILSSSFGLKSVSISVSYVCATASQLTEALLRATGKWKE